MTETITLHGRDSDTKDGVANAVVTPGELLELAGTNSDGDRQLQPHSSAPDLNGNGSAQPNFATEYSHTGGSIDDDYASGDHLEYRPCMAGDEVYAFIDAGQNVSEGAPLESAGNGALQEHSGLNPAGDGTDTMADDLIVGYAVEAVDNSGGSDPVRIRVEVR